MNLLLTIVLCVTMVIHIPLGYVVSVLANRDGDKKSLLSGSISSIDSGDSFHSAKSHFSDRSSSSKSKHKSSPRRSNSFSGSFDRKSSGSIRYPIDRARSSSLTSNRNVVMRNRWGHNLHGLPSMEAPNFYLKYRGFSIRPYLSKYNFSNRIYNNVWSDCNYECYWINNYDEYKKRVVANINLLRLSHGSGSVRQSDVLDEIAQNHANKMSRKNTLFTEYSQMYGVIIGMSFYPAASVIVTKWYDEHRKYNFLKNRPQPGTQSFTQLIWKNEKLIGVGVAKSKDLLFVACYFYPKGNIKNHYKRNVFRRRSRWFRGK